VTVIGHNNRAARRLVVTAISLAALIGCDLPRDPENTLERVTEGSLRVGVSEHDPWVLLGPGEPAGVEVEIVRLLAEDLDAEIEWIEGEVEELAAALDVGELDLLIAGLTSRSKISSEVALTHPYLTTQIVIGRPTGIEVDDIAGVEVAVEDSTEAAGLLEKTDAIPVRVDDVSEAGGVVAIDNFLLDDLGLEDTGIRLSETDHVMAVRHGENGWLVRVESFLLSDPKRIDRILEEGDGG
jgi:polar amino acid transport system substrate-binding protein